MKINKVIRIILGIILISIIIIAIANRGRFNVEMLEHWLARAGIWAPLVFIGIYAMATILFLPGSVLTIAGGLLFGPLWGTFYNLTGATIGAVFAFLIAKNLASAWVTKKIGGRLKILINGVENEGWRFVAFVRLVPIFPFNLLNYALGLTRIKLKHYAIATFFCMFPGALAYTYLGYVGKEAMGSGEKILQKGLLALGLLVLVTFLPYFIKRLKKKAGKRDVLDET